MVEIVKRVLLLIIVSAEVGQLKQFAIMSLFTCTCLSSCYLLVVFIGQSLNSQYNCFCAKTQLRMLKWVLHAKLLLHTLH